MTTHDKDKVIAAAKEAGTYIDDDIDGNPTIEVIPESCWEKFYAIAFQAGAASRDAEIVSLTNQRDYEYVRAENAEQERDQLRTELVKALAACKAKDEAILQENYSLALSFQPDDSALKAWLGEPVGEMHKAHARSLDEKPWCKEILLYSAGSPFDLPEYRVTVYSPKELK